MPRKILPIGMAPTIAQASLLPARRVMLSGERAYGLALQMTARAACEQKRVLFVCGDNRFDPYSVSRFARSIGARPEDALRSILIARAFTAYQMVELINRLGAKSAADLVVISGPCSTFLDEDLSFVDAARMFYRVLWKIVELAQSGMALMIAQGESIASPRRAYFAADLARASDVVLRLAGEHSFTVERHRHAALPQLPNMSIAQASTLEACAPRRAPQRSYAS